MLLPITTTLFQYLKIHFENELVDPKEFHERMRAKRFLGGENN